MVYKRIKDEDDKYGFVYLWYDRKHKRYYLGCHWGSIDDGYICSSSWMKQAYRIRPEDFKRKIIKTNIPDRTSTYIEEQRYLNMIRPDELRVRYYNLIVNNNEMWHKYPEHIKTVGQKISLATKGKKRRPPSDETRAKISAAKKGSKFSEEHREKLRQAKLGKKLAPEHRDKVIRTLKYNKYNYNNKIK